MDFQPVFMAFPTGILNVHDISTVRPYRADGTVPATEDNADGLRVVFRSKGTHLDLPGVTQEAFETRLQHMDLAI